MTSNIIRSSQLGARSRNDRACPPFAPKGRRVVVTGEAQRNPWTRRASSESAPKERRNSTRFLTPAALAFALLIGPADFALALAPPTQGGTLAPAAPRAAGRKLLSLLPEITPGFLREACFELIVQGEAVGHVRSTLKAADWKESGGKESQPRYAYEDFSVLRGPAGQRLELRTFGVLTRSFEPETVTWEVVSRPDGKTATGTSLETLWVGASSVTFEKGGGASTQKQEIDRPKGPFVHSTGLLFSLMPLRPGQRFVLREFDTETKAFVARMYSVTEKEGGRLRVAVSHERGVGETAYYVIGKDRAVEQHGSAAMPFIFRACPCGRIAEIEKEWASKPATSQPATPPAASQPDGVPTTQPSSKE